MPIDLGRLGKRQEELLLWFRVIIQERNGLYVDRVIVVACKLFDDCLGMQESRRAWADPRHLLCCGSRCPATSTSRSIAEELWEYDFDHH